MSEMLKSCPFCQGARAVLMPPTARPETPYDASHRLFPIVRCTMCYAEVPGNDEDYKGTSAIAAWNRRAPASDAGTQELESNRSPIPADAGTHPEQAPCTACNGDGEVHVPSSVPDDEGWQSCSVCGGTGKRPTDDEIAALRRRAEVAEGDLQAVTYERDQLRQRSETQAEGERERLAELVLAAKHLLVVQRSGDSEFIRENGRHGDTSPWAELVQATDGIDVEASLAALRSAPPGQPEREPFCGPPGTCTHPKCRETGACIKGEDGAPGEPEQPRQENDAAS